MIRPLAFLIIMRPVLAIPRATFLGGPMATAREQLRKNLTFRFPVMVWQLALMTLRAPEQLLRIFPITLVTTE